MPSLINIMESLIISLALLAGAGAAETQSAPVAKSQATATARILRGEQVRFGSFAQSLAENGERNDQTSYVLPLARSNHSASQQDSGELVLVEFY